MPSYSDFRPTLRLRQTLALSPDNGQVAYSDDGDGQFNAAVRSVAGGPARRLTDYTDNAVRWVTWQPDGRSLIFFADTQGDEKTQIYRIGLGEDKPEALTAVPGAQFWPALGSAFSPDHRLLAYAGNDRTPGEQDVLVRDMATGEVRRLYAHGGRMLAGHWSPDGTHLTAVDWIDNNANHVVYLVPAAGGPATRLTPQEPVATYWLGPWLPDGTGFVVRSNAGREFTGLAILDATTRRLTWLDTPDWDIEEATLSADGRTLVWLVNVDGASQLRARDLQTGEDLPTPTLPMGRAQDLSVSSDGLSAVMLLSTPTRPLNALFIDLRSGESRWLTQATPGTADPASLVEPALIHYPSRDGCRIPAYVYRPASTSGPVGVVISVHGGPQHQERPGYLYDGLYQYLTTKGLAVFAPNMRGSTGYGMPYQTRIYRDWGGVDLDDLADAVLYLREQRWVNPTRIGLFGGSYGGFVVLSALARLPDLNWAAGVARSGISNLVTAAKASPPTWRTKVVAVIGDPDTEADFLLSRSPVTYADNIRAPLFVIQGANDPRVPRQESDQIVGRLRACGVEVRYDIYSDEGHVFTKAENQKKLAADTAEFLIAHLVA